MTDKVALGPAIPVGETKEYKPLIMTISLDRETGNFGLMHGAESKDDLYKLYSALQTVSQGLVNGMRQAEEKPE